jgi:hypothetical protein
MLLEVKQKMPRMDIAQVVNLGNDYVSGKSSDDIISLDHRKFRY